jgi:hypothetical protein
VRKNGDAGVCLIGLQRFCGFGQNVATGPDETKVRPGEAMADGDFADGDAR